MATTTITITKKRGKTIVRNDKGQEWSFHKMDDATAVASLVFFTIYRQFDKMSMVSDNFTISFSMDSDFFKP